MSDTIKKKIGLTAAAAPMVIIGALSGSVVASALNAPDNTAGDGQTSVEQDTPELLVEYQGQVVGHIKTEDLSRIPPHEIGEPQDPFYPGEIGFRVYSSAGEIVGYATPRQGFVPVDQVARYEADPASFPLAGGTPAANAPTDELPPGFEPLGAQG